MIHDAKIEVTCDNSECDDYIEISPPYVYGDYSGNNGYYDTDDSTLNELIKQQEWGFIETEDGYEYYCEDCMNQFNKEI